MCSVSAPTLNKKTLQTAFNQVMRTSVLFCVNEITFTNI